MQQKRCVSDTNFHGQFKFIRAYSDQQIKRDIYKTLQKISRKGPGFSILFTTSVTLKKRSDVRYFDQIIISLFNLRYRVEDLKMWNGTMDLYFNLYARSKQSALSILSAAVDLQHNRQHCAIKRPAVLKLQKTFCR